MPALLTWLYCLNHFPAFASLCGASPQASGLWLLCVSSGLARPRAHADRLQGHALCWGGLHDDDC